MSARGRPQHLTDDSSANFDGRKFEVQALRQVIGDPSDKRFGLRLARWLSNKYRYILYEVYIGR